MQSLKRGMIKFCSLILCSVLGALLILGNPAYANDEITMCESELGQLQPDIPCNLNSGQSYTLNPNTAYKIKPENCAQPVYAQFNFSTDDINFDETYPIQVGWELNFNTPLASEMNPGDIGKLTIKEILSQIPNKCQLQLYEEPLKLLSGFKTKTEAEENESGHFIIAKDYYGAIPKSNINFDNCKNEGNYVKGRYCYEPLGSLSSITGDNFPALGGAAIGQLIIKPNGIRAPHWHLQFAEAGYCYQGIGQVGVIVPSKTIPKSKNSDEFYPERIIEEIFVKNNEVFLFPESSQHYLRNISNEEDFACVLFFTEGTPLNGDQLLSITLQNIVGNTPLGVMS